MNPLDSAWDRFKSIFGQSAAQPTDAAQPADPNQPDVTWHDGYQAPDVAPAPTSASISMKTHIPASTSSAPKQDIESLFPSTGQDAAKQQAEMESENKTRKLSLIPQAIAGIGDVLATANQTYGVKGPTNGLKTVQEETAQGIDLNKSNLDKSIASDPNSDLSHQYQAIAYKAFQMLGVNPKPEDLANMSAAQIQQQMPNIDKLASMQNAKDMKEAQLTMAAAYKKLAADRQSDTQDQKASDSVNRFVEGELRGRASSVAIQNQKVDSAIHAKELMEGARNPKTGQIELNQIQLPELAMNLTNLITGTNTSTVEQFRDMKPETLKSYVAQKAGYLIGQPVDVTTQGWTDALSKLLDRQGATSEYLRNNSLQGLKSRVKASYPSWYGNHGDEYFKSQFGNSYVDRYMGGQNPVNPAPQSNQVPQVGSTFQGGKVLKVTRIQ